MYIYKILERFAPHPQAQFYISRLSFLEHLPNSVQKSFEKVTSFIIDMALLLSDFIFISYYFM